MACVLHVGASSELRPNVRCSYVTALVRPLLDRNAGLLLRYTDNLREWLSVVSRDRNLVSVRQRAYPQTAVCPCYSEGSVCDSGVLARAATFPLMQRLPPLLLLRWSATSQSAQYTARLFVKNASLTWLSLPGRAQQRKAIIPSLTSFA